MKMRPARDGRRTYHGSRPISPAPARTWPGGHARRSVGGKPVTQRSAVGAELTMPQLLVPAYFHPASHPGEWAWLASRAAQVRFIVLNVANGPGPSLDSAFTPVLERLRSAGVAVGGYVDTNYGQRPGPGILADLGRHLE